MQKRTFSAPSQSRPDRRDPDIKQPENADSREETVALEVVGYPANLIWRVTEA